MIKAFRQALPILENIENAGFEAYFVGGSVRDYLLKKEIDDVDIATSATPEEIKEIFPKTIDVGIEHGTILVLFKGQTYEITTFRSESEYEDFRRPKNVTFIRSLYEDLKRRDFTMNAIAMDHEGKIIDPFLGLDAIKNNLLQTVGIAEDRFSEDALRMMRAIRFVSQLAFDIEEETFIALKSNGALLKNISIERKTKEFEKLLTGKNRQKAIELMIESKLHQFLPGLESMESGIKKLSQFNCGKLMLTEMWVLLLYSLGIHSKASHSFLKDWRLSNQKMKEVEKILAFLEKRLVQDWEVLSLYQAGEAISISVEKIKNVIHNELIDNHQAEIKTRYDSLPIKAREELAVTGRDLMVWASEPGGPWLKELLDKIEQGVLLHKVKNDKEAIREWLLSCNPK
jgi:tRNA nucleotidyltransferase (CCA-adding enzyme)